MHTTFRVHLEVDGTFREDRSRTRFHFVENESCSVLSQQSRLKCSVDSEVELCCTRMRVWGVIPTRTEETNGHSHASTDQGGECASVCRYGVATGTLRLSCTTGRVQEVENELRNMV